MSNQELDLFSTLQSLDEVASEPVPAGWSRRNWVHKEAAVLAASLVAQAPEELPPVG